MHVVELQVFAGRPNPRWVLRRELEPRLWAIVRRLHAPAAPVLPRLGYQGLLVYGHGADGAWVPWLRVFDSTVTVLQGPAAGVYRDTEGLEDSLLDEAERASLHEVLAAALPDRKRDP